MDEDGKKINILAILYDILHRETRYNLCSCSRKSQNKIIKTGGNIQNLKQHLEDMYRKIYKDLKVKTSKLSILISEN